MLLTNILLTGLEIVPSQVCGSIRIVPLVRHKNRGDLRLQNRKYNDDLSIVSVDKNINYYSYIPHGMVMSWSDDGSTVANMGINITKKDGKSFGNKYASVQLMHRMAKRESKNTLRFLPLHLAMEGFISLYFNAPKIAWDEYSTYTKSSGLGFRTEYSVSGREIFGLEEALRVFEIHQGQVGVLVYVAEALASAFVVPTPEDYRALHYNLLEDFYGELMYRYALMYDQTYSMDLSIDASKISNLADLRSAVVQMRKDWASFNQSMMLDGLLDRQINSQLVYTAGSFKLQRFVTQVSLRDEENHIGEAIIRDNGELEYLHTYRLTAAQSRRVYYLRILDENNWNLQETAKALGCTQEEFVRKMETEGFGYLFRQQIRDKARKANKR
jgi:hypothetical protein